MLRRGAAAAAHDIDQAFFGEILQEARCDIGRFIKAGVAHRVGQAGIGVAADKRVARNLGELLNVGAHQCCAECAIEAYSEWPRVAHTVPKSCDGLAAQNAAGGIRHRAADDEGQAFAGVFKKFVDGEQRGFGVERVENRFNQEQIGATFNQGFHLFVISSAKFFKCHVARARVVHIGADAGRFRCGAERAGDEARFIRRRKLVTCRPSNFCGLHIHLASEMRHFVIFLSNGRCAKGIRFDQIAASSQVALMNIRNHIGARDAEQFVVAFDVFWKIREALASVLGLGQLKTLNHRAHRTVQYGNAVFENSGQLLGAGVDNGLHCAILEDFR